jgi:hypothetical protein
VLQPKLRTSPVTPLVALTVPFAGAARFGAHASGVQVGPALQVLLAWQVAVAGPVSV